MAIRAGEVWEYEGETVEFMNDVCAGDVIGCVTIKINGAHPPAGTPVPTWMMHDIGDGTFQLRASAPSHVNVR